MLMIFISIKVMLIKLLKAFNGSNTCSTFQNASTRTIKDAEIGGASLNLNSHSGYKNPQLGYRQLMPSVDLCCVI